MSVFPNNTLITLLTLAAIHHLERSRLDPKLSMRRARKKGNPGKRETGLVATEASTTLTTEAAQGRPRLRSLCQQVAAPTRWEGQAL